MSWSAVGHLETERREELLGEVRTSVLRFRSSAMCA
jgi:hypothetical protein